MFLSKLWGYLAGFGVLIVAVLAALGLAKRAGVKEERAAETEKALEQAKEASDVDARVRNMSDSELDEQLRSARRPPPK